MPKPKKCRICKQEYSPFTSLQKTCSIPCSIKLVNADRAKAEAGRAKERRKDTRQRREKLKTRSDHLADAQRACNAYVRERDKNEPCISCGTTKPDIQYAAGHYKTVGGHPELRFHANFNINRQCNRYCNKELSGNIGKYREGLIKKIGIKNVEWLEGPHKAQNLSVFEIKEIKQWYKDQLKLIRGKE